jgi:hypothetical protein
VSTPAALVRSMPDVFAELLDQGAELVFAGKHSRSIRIPDEISGDSRVDGAVLPLRREAAAAGEVRLFRSLCDLAWSLEPAMADMPWTRKRAAERVLRLLEHPDRDSLSQRADEVDLPATVAEALSVALAQIEGLLPPAVDLEEAIRGLGVDEIFLVSRCVRYGPERDVIKVARGLEIPSAMLVFSWDNLSSKAVLNEHPDRLLVWNEVQAREAVELHGLARERVRVVGAANFDRFFTEVEVERRQASTRENGSPATILYLCSSTNVVAQEPLVLARWLSALRASDEPRLREARVVVRPHPGKGTKVFESWAAPDERVRLVKPHAKAARLASALVEADVVVALNTSAEIEAAIAGRPVLTFRAGADALGQEGSGHFPYLLEANGGFVIDSPNLEEHLRRLATVLRGEHDQGAVARALERFIRPAGLAQAVSPLVASAVLELAAQSKALAALA